MFCTLLQKRSLGQKILRLCIVILHKRFLLLFSSFLNPYICLSCLSLCISIIYLIVCLCLSLCWSIYLSTWGDRVYDWKDDRIFVCLSVCLSLSLSLVNVLDISSTVPTADMWVGLCANIFTVEKYEVQISLSLSLHPSINYRFLKYKLGVRFESESSVCASFSLSVCLSVCLPICLSVCLSAVHRQIRR